MGHHLGIRYNVDGSVATVTIDRPARRNALTEGMIAALLRAVGTAAANDAVRVIVLSGVGGTFSSGTDLGFPETIGPAHDAIWDVMRENGGWWPIVACPKPVVAAVDGPAIGLGAELASHCDVRVVTDRSWFQWNFVHRGLVADTGAGTWLLPRLIGVPRALELLFTGRRLPADEAKSIGYVARVVEPARLASSVAEIAERIGAVSPLSARLTKGLVYEGLSSTAREHLDAHVAAFVECLASRDHAEGVAAFIERRTPLFDER
jgi:enoyl-CoA hydratase/carnithine racemase